MARLRVETGVYKEDEKFWLRHGPGREFPGRPGWSAPARAAPRPARTPGAMTELRWNAIQSTLLRVLAPFPEARQA